MKRLLLPLALSIAWVAYSWSQDPAPQPVDKSAPQATKSPYEKITIEEILDKSEDLELVRLSGEIIKKLKCSTYLFRDETGEIRIQIDNQDIPDKGLLFNTPAIIHGDVEPATIYRPVRVEADKIRYFF